MEAAPDGGAAAARHVTLDLSFKNQHHVLTLPASTPLLEIQALAETKTGIVPGHQKLIHKGKTLIDPTITLGQLGGETRTVKLVLIGTTAAALAALADGPKQVRNVRIINDLGGTGGSGSRGMVPILRSRRYGFQRVDVLPHLLEQEKARRILTELASDPGVLHVMEKYQWSVGALCEMYPEGLVGVSSVCIMGLNENKGQRILLRLRTDDLQGWRKVLSVRKVLYHEMAHNVHSDHDDQFHILMRTIEREANAFNSSGRAIGGSTYIQADSTAWGPAAFTGGSGRLGGASANLTQVLPARVMAGHAAMQRLSEEEQAIEDACASGRHATPTLPTLTPSHHHTGNGCCNSSSSSSSSSRSSSSGPVVPPSQQEREDLHSSLPHHHHSEPPVPVGTAVPPAMEKEQSVLETPSLPAPSAVAAQAPPTLLSANPWAENTPTPAVAAEREKEASPPQLSSSMSPPQAPPATAAHGEEQTSLPLSPPPDELTTTTTTQHITIADTAATTAMDDATEQLLGLGFAEVEVRRALQECGGDVMHAADYLLLLAAAEEDRGGGGGGGGGGMDSDNNDNAAAAAAAAAAAVVDSAFAPPPDSRQARVMEAVQRLVQQTQGEQEAGTLAFTTLQSMLQTLLDHPQEPKYKRVRLSNAKLQRAVGRFPPAMDLLRAVGFEEREGGQVLEYTRNDPGLLWWGKSAVEGAQEQAGRG